MLAQQSSSTELQSAINQLIEQSKSAIKKDTTLLQTQAATTAKVSADEFDKCDSSSAEMQTKQNAKQEAGMLDQAKALADNMDSAAQTSDKPAAQQNVQTEESLNEGLAADNAITTSELEQ